MATIGEAAYVKEETDAFEKKLGSTPITFATAKLLVEKGLKLCEQTKNLVQDGGNKLIGSATWNVPKEHLEWHKDAIAKELAGRNPDVTVYDRAADLRQYVVRAYRGYVIAQQDSAMRAAIKTEFWAEVKDSLSDVTQNPVQKLTGLPTWAWVLIGVGGVIGVGTIILKLAGTSAGGAVIHNYLPRRR